MKIVSVISESFLEYEDHISLVLFTFGCNFHCDYCYNYSTISDPNAIINKPVMDIIQDNINPLIDGLVWLGGEPTIYGRELIDVSHDIKKRYKLDIKLFTNGSNQDIITQGIVEGAFDKISVDFKTLYNNTGCFMCSYPSHQLQLLDTLRDEHKRIEIRTTQAAYISDKEISDIKNICDGYGYNYIVQQDVTDSYRRLGII